MPSYVQVSIALAVVTLVFATVMPAPRLHPAKLGWVVLGLMAAAGVTFVFATTVMVLGVIDVLPGPIVIVPSIAGLAVSVIFCMTMCWIVSAKHKPEPVLEADESGEDDGGGGGGGLRPEDEPPRDPGPPDGMCWDAFDRERQAWEDARTERDRHRERERELVDA